MGINQDTTLKEALEIASPEEREMFDSLKRLISNTDLTTEEINEVLKPYAESIRSDDDLTVEEMQEIITILLNK